MFASSKGWLPLSLDGHPNESEKDQEDQEFLIANQASKKEWQRKSYLHFFFLVVLFLSVLLNVYLFASINRHLDLNKVCGTFTSQYESPIEKDVAITYDSVLFNGSIFKETVYRNPPGPEVDKAWMALGTDYRPVVVPENEAHKYGLPPSDFVKRRKDHGGGVIAYVEALHHLHCLNLLRKASHFSYEYYHNEGKDAFSNDEEVLRLHFGHCLDILRQQIMCTADFTVFGELWIKDQPAPSPDFNRMHKCKSFEKIRSWAEVNQISQVDETIPEYEYRAEDTILSELP